MEKINVAELLKDCPKGMELDCNIFSGLEFDHIDGHNGSYPIICRAKTTNGKYRVHTFTKHGCYSTEMYSKCVIYPKDETTWEGFVPPCQFKDGDVISDGEFIAIFHKFEDDHLYYRCWHNKTTKESKYKTDFGIGYYYEYTYATEEEKEKLFQAIKDNGYKWNAETKTLEKLVEPKFKVGDKVRGKYTNNIYTISCITPTGYELTNGQSFTYNAEDCLELVPDKFDITTLIPFESRVLVRDFNSDRWKVSFWGCLADDCDSFKYDTTRGYYKQCIPYEGNEHLLGKADDCIDFYKNWE